MARAMTSDRADWISMVSSGKAKLGRNRRASGPLRWPAPVDLPVPQAEPDHVLDPDGGAPAEQHGRGHALGGDQDVDRQDDDTISRCRVAERRSIRPGSWAIRTPSSTSCSTGNTDHPGTRPRWGMPT